MAKLKTKTTKPKQMLSSIEQLEQKRDSKVVVYFTGEKEPNFQTQIASDSLSLFKSILEKFGSDNKKISLVLNTSGGRLETPWPLVNLIREYCKTFEVIVLEKALSAGTLIALGADKIVMLPYSQLSPIDPAANIVNQENNQVERMEIEDIIGYIDFAKEKVGIAEQSALAEIMKELTKQIKPTILGSVNRTHALINRLAKSLLNLHKNHISEKQSEEIVGNLTQKLYSHQHLINRRESRDMIGFGDIIEFAKPTTKEICEIIFNEITEDLELKSKFDPQSILGSASEKNIKMKRAIIESKDVKFTFTSDYLITKTPDPTGKENVLVANKGNEWVIEK
jgi:ATP-dependent protease ClpP protease subunit